MNKKQFIKEFAKKAGVTNKVANEQLDIMLGIISDVVSKEEQVVIPDFGKFEVKTVPERKGINPRTRQTIVIPEHKKVVFKAYNNFNVYSLKY